MKLITIAGAPSAGKTAVALHFIRQLQRDNVKAVAVKFDTLRTVDDRTYREQLGIPAIQGLSDYLCPDHYFVSNLEEAYNWGRAQNADVLILETAGLCYRCAPHVHGIPAITVIDNLGGMEVPAKMGPTLTLADVVVITKSDLVSQAEKEVFAYRIGQVNPKAIIMHMNGLNGVGSLHLKKISDAWTDCDHVLTGQRLRYSMPASICSYCTGETRIGKQYQSGNVQKILWGGSMPCA